MLYLPYTSQIVRIQYLLSSIVNCQQFHVRFSKGPDIFFVQLWEINDLKNFQGLRSSLFFLHCYFPVHMSRGANCESQAVTVGLDSYHFSFVSWELHPWTRDPRTLCEPNLDLSDRWLPSRWKITQMFLYCQVQIDGKRLKRPHRGKKLCTMPGLIALYDFRPFRPGLFTCLVHFKRNKSCK